MNICGLEFLLLSFFTLCHSLPFFCQFLQSSKSQVIFNLWKVEFPTRTPSDLETVRGPRIHFSLLYQHWWVFPWLTAVVLSQLQPSRGSIYPLLLLLPLPTSWAKQMGEFFHISRGVPEVNSQIWMPNCSPGFKENVAVRKLWVPCHENSSLIEEGSVP